MPEPISLHEIRTAIDVVDADLVRLLARREHSVKELGEKLSRRPGADSDTVREVVQELAAKGLVSDERYAEAWARDAVRLSALRMLKTALTNRSIEKG